MKNNMIHCIREKLMNDERERWGDVICVIWDGVEAEEYIHVNNLRLLQRVTSCNHLHIMCASIHRIYQSNH